MTTNQHLWQLERSHVDHVLHYSHWIPIGRGFTDKMMAKFYPGWSYAQLIQLFDIAGIRILPKDLGDARGAPHGGRCHWQVVSFSFTDKNNFHVSWDRTIPYDKAFVNNIVPNHGCPAGDGPRSGKQIRSRRTQRPVDLSGETFFE